MAAGRKDIELPSAEFSSTSGPSSESACSRQGNRTAQSNSFSDQQRAKLKFITWNIDGQSEEDLLPRALEICKKIKRLEPDVVLLQEVITKTAEIISSLLVEYRCLYDDRRAPYFTGTLLKKTTTEYESHEIIPFPGSVMGRGVLKVTATFGNAALCLMNTHLESMKQNADERKRQLCSVFENIACVPQTQTVLFGGDLNLRDYEVDEIGGLPDDIADLWEECGSPPESRYTWNMQINDNLDFGTNFGPNFGPRLRFDRVFIRNSASPNLFPINRTFGLIGRNRIPRYGCFPSDHWGILCHFAVS